MRLLTRGFVVLCSVMVPLAAASGAAPKGAVATATPTVSKVEVVNRDQTVFGLGETLELRALFHRKVDLSQCSTPPALLLDFWAWGDDWDYVQQRARFVSGDDHQNLYFNYEVREGAYSDDAHVVGIEGWQCIRDFQTLLPMTAADAAKVGDIDAMSRGNRPDLLVDGYPPSLSLYTRQTDGSTLPGPDTSGRWMISPRATPEVDIELYCEPGLPVALTITTPAESLLVDLDCASGTASYRFDHGDVAFDGSEIEIGATNEDAAGNVSDVALWLVKRTNEAPVVTNVRLTDLQGAPVTSATPTDMLRCAAEVDDPDGDPVSTEYLFSVTDAQSVATLFGSTGRDWRRLPQWASGVTFGAGKHVACKVRASDLEFRGEGAAERASAAIDVQPGRLAGC